MTDSPRWIADQIAGAIGRSLFPRAMALEPFLGSLFQDLGRRLVHPNGCNFAGDGGVFRLITEVARLALRGLAAAKVSRPFRGCEASSALWGKAEKAKELGCDLLRDGIPLHNTHFLDGFVTFSLEADRDPTLLTLTDQNRIVQLRMLGAH